MGKCKFSAKWTDIDKYKPWLAATGSDTEAKCNYSRKIFTLGTMGIKAIDSHMQSIKHKTFAEAARCSTGLMPAMVSRAPEANKTFCFSIEDIVATLFWS